MHWGKKRQGFRPSRVRLCGGQIGKMRGRRERWGLEFGALVDGASSSSAGGRWGCDCWLMIGGLRDGMEMVYECFSRHMASTSQWSSLVDLQLIEFPLSARLMVPGLHRVATGYTRPGPASSVSASCPLPVLAPYYMYMPLTSDPFDRIDSFSSDPYLDALLEQIHKTHGQTRSTTNSNITSVNLASSHKKDTNSSNSIKGLVISFH
ncbi:hypothetical protein V8C34DRAFT_283851 [Trichoderma compactum]